MASNAGELPLVSVIIPAFNAEFYITSALDSVRAQSVGSYEILVIDDCSTDRTCAVVQKIAASDPRIILLRSAANGGPSRARNIGIDNARGMWIAILDADDRWKADRLRRLIDLASAQSADAIADNYMLHDESRPFADAPAFTDDRPWSRITAERFLYSERPGGRIRFGMLKPIFRRQFLDSKGLRYSEAIRYAEDFHFFMGVLLEGGHAILSSEPLYVYTLPSSVVTGAKSGGSRTVPRLDDRIWIADDLIRRYHSSVPAPLLKAIQRYRGWMIATRDGKHFLDQWRRRKRLAALLNAASRPKATLIYALSSAPVKKIRHRLTRGCPPVLKF